jgi:hypothetical protein
MIHHLVLYIPASILAAFISPLSPSGLRQLTLLLIHPYSSLYNVAPSTFWYFLSGRWGTWGLPAAGWS